MVARDWAGQRGGEAERSPVKGQKTLSGKIMSGHSSAQ